MKENYIVPYVDKGSIYDETEIVALRDILMRDTTLSCGPQRKMFEEEFAEFVNRKYAFTVTNCTTALEFATYLTGLQPGDEVITTPITYQATIQSLLTMPIKVNFCDIDENTLGVNVAHLKTLISSRTKAIYVTHYGGLIGDMDSVTDIATQHNIVVIEDCAHAIGSEYMGRKAGSIGHIGCFSFQSLKNMSTLGEGGMLTFNSDQYAAVISRIRANEPDARFVPLARSPFGDHQKPHDGVVRHEKNAYTHDCVAILHPGTNATLSEPAAVVGRIQLKKLADFNNRRRKIAMQLDAGLSGIRGIRLQKVPSYCTHTYHLYTFFVDPDCHLERNEVITALDAEGIEIVLRYFPIHLLPEWRYHGHKLDECPIAENIWFNELVNLPCYPTLTTEQVDFMIDKVKQVLGKLCR